MVEAALNGDDGGVPNGFAAPPNGDVADTLVVVAAALNGDDGGVPNGFAPTGGVAEVLGVEAAPNGDDGGV